MRSNLSSQKFALFAESQSPSLRDIERPQPNRLRKRPKLFEGLIHINQGASDEVKTYFAINDP